MRSSRTCGVLELFPAGNKPACGCVGVWVCVQACVCLPPAGWQQRKWSTGPFTTFNCDYTTVKTINASSYIHTPPSPTPPHIHTHKHTPMPLRFPPRLSVFIYVWQRCRMGWWEVEVAWAGERWSAAVTSVWRILWSVLHPSVSILPPAPSLPPITSPCSLSPSRSQLLRPGLSPPPRPGRSGDGGLSAELEQKAGAPNLPDGALEAEGRGPPLFYHLCVSIKGTHFELTFTARYVRAVNTLSRMFPLHGK